MDTCNESKDNTWYGDPNYNGHVDPTLGVDGGGINIRYLSPDGVDLIFAINTWYDQTAIPSAGQVTIQQTMATGIIPPGYIFVPSGASNI
jgi:hypothetical protein